MNSRGGWLGCDWGGRGGRATDETHRRIRIAALPMNVSAVRSGVRAVLYEEDVCVVVAMCFGEEEKKHRKRVDM
jgi:hypothetical protein